MDQDIVKVTEFSDSGDILPQKILPDVEQNETVSDLAEAVATVSSLNISQTGGQSNSELSNDESENSPSQMLDPGGKSSTQEFRAERGMMSLCSGLGLRQELIRVIFTLRVGFCSTVTRYWVSL